MGMWTIREEHDGYDRDFGMRGKSEIEEAYREGCRHGYEKAMSEMRGGGMGFHENGRYDSDGMNERRMPGYFPESPMYGDMGERRRRRSNGEFY